MYLTGENTALAEMLPNVPLEMASIQIFSPDEMCNATVKNLA